MLRAEGILRLERRGLSRRSAAIVVDHLEQADAAGKPGHGLGRIPWIEGLLGSEVDPSADPERLERTDGFERWHGRRRARLPHAARCLRVADRRPRPSGRGSSSARRAFRRASSAPGRDGSPEAVSSAVVTATSPRRLPHPDGGGPLTGTNPIAIAVPSSDGGAVRRGRLDGRGDARRRAVRRARNRRSSSHSVGRRPTRPSRSPPASSCLVGALAGPAHGAVVLAARPEHDPLPAFPRARRRAAAAGRRRGLDRDGGQPGERHRELALVVGVVLELAGEDSRCRPACRSGRARRG